MSEDTVRVAGIDHVSITSGDLDRSVWFYGEILGLKMRGRGDSASAQLSTLVGLPDVKIRWAEFVLGEGQILELIEYVSPEGTPVEQRACDPGSGHFAFQVDDLDRLHRRLVDAGVTVRSEPVELEEEGDWRGFRCLYSADPDGFTIEFVQLPPERRPAGDVVRIPDLVVERPDS